MINLLTLKLLSALFILFHECANFARCNDLTISKLTEQITQIEAQKQSKYVFEDEQLMKFWTFLVPALSSQKMKWLTSNLPHRVSFITVTAVILKPYMKLASNPQNKETQEQVWNVWFVLCNEELLDRHKWSATIFAYIYERSSEWIWFWNQTVFEIWELLNCFSNQC